MLPSSGEASASADPTNETTNPTEVTMASCHWATISNQPILLLQDQNSNIFIVPSASSIKPLTNVNIDEQTDLPKMNSNIVWLNPESNLYRVESTTEQPASTVQANVLSQFNDSSVKNNILTDLLDVSVGLELLPNLNSTVIKEDTTKLQHKPMSEITNFNESKHNHDHSDIHYPPMEHISTHDHCHLDNDFIYENSENENVENQVYQVDKFINDHPVFTKQAEFVVKCTICSSSFLSPDTNYLNTHLHTDKHEALLSCSEDDKRMFTQDEIVKHYRYLKRYDSFISKDSRGLFCRICPNVRFSLNKPDNISAHRRKCHLELPVFEKDFMKRKASLVDKLNYASIVLSKYGDYYFWKEGNVYCKICRLKLEPIDNYSNYPRLAKEHLKSVKHDANVKIAKEETRPKPTKRQDPFLTPPKKVPVELHSRDISDNTVIDAAKVMMYCKAPVNQADKSFRNAIVQQCQQEVSPSTIEKRGVPLLHQKLTNYRRDYFQDKKIYFQIDETSNKKTMFANLVIGVLDETMTKVPIDVQVIDKKDGDAMFVHIMTTLRTIFGEPPIEQICLLVTDSASAMVKCGELLQARFPRLIHIFCVAHKVHLVAEKIRELHPELDWFIGRVKLVMTRSGERSKFFTDTLGIDSFPIPHYIRWGTWLISANYLFHHFDDVLCFIRSLKVVKRKKKVNLAGDEEAETSSTIQELQNYISDESKLTELKRQIKFVYSNYCQLPRYIKNLEKGKVLFNTSFRIYQNIEPYLSEAIIKSTNESEIKIANEVYNKYKEAFDSNIGLHKIEEICSTDPNSYFMFSPITSTECERFFAFFRLNFMEQSNRHLGDETLALQTAIQSNFRKDTKTVAKQEKKQCKIKAYDDKYIPVLSRRLQYEESLRKIQEEPPIKRKRQIESSSRVYRCKWSQCQYQNAGRYQVVTHVRVVHFKLPRSLKEQKEKNILDDRNPNEFVETSFNQLFLS